MRGRGNAVPVPCETSVQTVDLRRVSLEAKALQAALGHLHSVALGLVVEISSEEGKEIVHFGLEQLRPTLVSELRPLAHGGGGVRDALTFFCSGFSTVLVRLLKALRIWAAATLVDVFSKACAMSESSASAAPGAFDTA